MKRSRFELILLLTSLLPVIAEGQDLAVTLTPVRHFRGIYLSADVGRQNVIGGSLIQGVDVLQQAARTVSSFALGIRGEFASGVVLGAEFGRGVGNQDLLQDTNPAGFRVTYANSDQSHIGATVGKTLGTSRRLLAFVYVSEVTRTFDVTIQDRRGGSSTFPITTQEDEQGLLRFGVGVERALGRFISLRATVGSSRADFGEKATNIDVSRLVDASIGVTFRLPL